MPEPALVLTNGYYDTVFAKTTHGLVRGPSRYWISGVVDAEHAGQDAGRLLDGMERGIPIWSCVAAALEASNPRPTHCIVGVATVGGRLPASLRADLEEAARAGLTLVNGLHQLLSEDDRIRVLAQGRIIDIRRPRAASALRFWTGEVRAIPALRIAVLGMDCAIGKRTTAMLIREACRAAGLGAEVIYTGQTGWLQGLEYGFIFDATLNDFVSGELEGAILRCYQETRPDVILLEGQSALRNPSGPAGAELICSGDAQGVILQHAPRREYFEDFEEIECRIPPLEEEIELIGLLGAKVWAITLFTRGMTPKAAGTEAGAIEAACGIPVVCPLIDGVARIVDIIRGQLAAW
ncbi:MAG: DUF1611 domain-containing protein [Bacteroidota bacterium]|nr:DUF1611 domain-containing protein [Bacteroidota bacterium]MDE2956486.1 DUF1611 domain-containing protein [Bacteroidota bacterium]